MTNSVQLPGPAGQDWQMLGIIDQQPRRAVVADWDWQVLGACRGMNVDMFYHPAGERRQRRSHRVNRAKTIARPVR